MLQGEPVGQVGLPFAAALGRMGLSSFAVDSEPLDLERVACLHLLSGDLLEAERLGTAATRGLAEELRLQGRSNFRDAEAREGSFGWCLTCLSGLAVVGDWVDQAPAAFEEQVPAQLKRMGIWLDRLDAPTSDYPVLIPWLRFERARYLCFQGQEAAAGEHLQAVLEDPVSHVQTGLLERAVALLRTLDQPGYDPSFLLKPYLPASVAEWERILQTLTEIPKLLETESPTHLPHACVSLLADLLQPHQAFWLEQREGNWETVAYHGPPGFATFSRAFVREALEKGGLVQDPVVSDPTESLILSEARAVLVELVHVCGEVSGVLYLSHRNLEARYRKGELELLAFVARIVGSHLSAQEVLQRRQRADLAVVQERQRLIEVYNKTNLGISWLDESGALLEWNSAFAKLHPGVVTHLPFWRVMAHDEQRKAQRFVQRALQGKGLETEIFRSQNSLGEADWHAYQIEILPGGTRLCTTQPISSEKLDGLIYFLEQEKHWQAADLHDGPCQDFGALSLTAGQENQGDLQEILELIDWLSSPLHSDQSPERAFSGLCRRMLPEVEWVVKIDTGGWNTAGVSMYRIFQDFLEHFTDSPTPARLELELSRSASGLRLELTGLSTRYPGNPSTQARIRLHSGRLEHFGHSLVITLSGPDRSPLG